ncbi:flagellar hook-associated protein FlgK [Clostridium botulinum]|uniref:flagellar hook-associated protein FlgK n=1 Tax=Clostridium botulinum TaxID=1491 RepID=UPI000774C5F9|nr:flagellar hook-associated protein FlgK [Clostridium botulinum]NFH79839.1 flagellar hook-associated protein FlgK [Clostridium botulinum]NFH82316.1 flagellar hook-associated protein FlgK [Clostridium botulinum]NFH90655.1 flagellar hook-associated protein FlgK [Clostridium botulinum]NFI11423.1 flagellar hook-associated protein FlgK [Clostridium botulinum]NFI14526.1 flagellar hook-associated protein FlgK [Clostridium botulinum]
MAGLFDTFTVAKRGLNVQQGAINTTSHNIANANTIGFSRQRAVATTTRPFGGMSRFDTCTVGQVGTGAEISSIERIRDSFIDFQVRHENGKLGNYDVQDKFLYRVENIFGEPSDSGIQQLLGEFFDSFQELSKKPHDSSTKTIALQKASALADALNNTYTQLDKQLSDAQELLQVNVKDVNNYLDQINELNKQIASVCAVGQTPNDLMDARDNLLDQLSSKFGITIDRKEKESIDLKLEGYQNGKNPVNNLVNSNPTDDKYTRFSYVKNAEVEKDAAGKYTVKLQYHPLGNLNAKEETITIECADEDEAKKIAESLTQNRVLMGDKDGIVGKPVPPATTVTMSSDDINKKILQTHKLDVDVNTVDNKHIKGDIAGNQGVQDTIKGYMADLDRIAVGLAYAVNAIQTGSQTPTDKYELIFTNGADVTGLTGVAKNEKLEEKISAKNITVNKDVLKDVSLLNTSSKDEAGEGNGDRALAIANLRNVKMNLTNSKDIKNRNDFFANTKVNFDDGINMISSAEGSTINAYYKEIINTLGVNAETASRNVTSQTKILKDLEMQRLSVSGVSLDEEMTNLIQFQHAYSANAKVISTVDELLDVVINGLKR